MKKPVISVLLTGILLIFFVSNGLCETPIKDIIDNATPFLEKQSDADAVSTNQTPDTSPPASTGEQPSESATNIQTTEKSFYALQIGAFLKESAAEQKIIELKNAGYEPYIFQSVNSRNQTIYAVRIGRYKDYQTAAAALADIRAGLKLPAFVAEYDSLEPATTTGRAAPEIKVAAAPKEKPVEKPIEKPAPSAPAAVPETIEEQPELPKGPPTLESLQKKIQSLESSIKQLGEEAEVRKKLKMSEQEKSEQEQEEDILDAAGKEYTLTRAGNIKFRYSFGYSYSTYDAIRQASRVEPVADHHFANSFGVSYGVKDNLSIGAGIPFIYAYDKVGTIDSKDVTGLGDVSLNWKLQPFKKSSDRPSIIVNGSFRIPTGQSPYDIQVGEELSTGSGIYSTSLGVSVSQTTDPVVVFSSLSISYPFKTTNINQKRAEGVLMEVDPGMGFGAGLGMGYALSYKLNLNMSFSYSYSFQSKYSYKNATSAKSGIATSASLRLGVGYKFRRNQNLNFSIGLPVTSSRSFSFSFSTPIEFKL